MSAIGTGHVCGLRDSFKPPLTCPTACFRAHPEDRSCLPCPKLNFWSTYPLLEGSVPLDLQNELSLNPQHVPKLSIPCISSVPKPVRTTHTDYCQGLRTGPFTFPFQVQSQNVCPINTFLFLLFLFLRNKIR